MQLKKCYFFLVVMLHNVISQQHMVCMYNMGTQVTVAAIPNTAQ